MLQCVYYQFAYNFINQKIKNLVYNGLNALTADKWYPLYVVTQPQSWAGYDTRSIFK